jgi:hypothetical protein
MVYRLSMPLSTHSTGIHTALRSYRRFRVQPHDDRMLEGARLTVNRAPGRVGSTQPLEDLSFKSSAAVCWVDAVPISWYQCGPRSRRATRRARSPPIGVRGRLNRPEETGN